jgi:hypothetical protein
LGQDDDSYAPICRNRGSTLIQAEPAPHRSTRRLGATFSPALYICSPWKERVVFGLFGRNAVRFELAASIITEAAIYWARV